MFIPDQMQREEQNTLSNPFQPYGRMFQRMKCSVLWLSASQRGVIGIWVPWFFASVEPLDVNRAPEQLIPLKKNRHEDFHAPFGVNTIPRWELLL